MSAPAWIGRPLGSLRKHGRIARQFVRIGLIRKSQFRLEFLNQIVMDTVWYASHVTVIEVLYSQIDSIAGWSAAEMRVFLGILFACDAFMMMWLGQAWHFGSELKDGILDSLRLRPASPILLYFFQRFSLEACFNMALALAYLVWALLRLPVESGAGAWGEALPWVRVPFGLLLAFWTQTVLTVMFTLFEFRLLNANVSFLLREAFQTGGEYPIDVFTRRLRLGLLFLVPIGLLASVPAAFTVGRLETAAFLGFSLWAVALGFLTFRAWRRGFRHYTSALS